MQACLFLPRMTALTLIFAMSFCLWTARADSCKRYANGCTITGLDLGMCKKEVVRRATDLCDSHDVCYSCGRKFGLTKSECDKMLHTRLQNTCDTYNSGQLAKYMGVSRGSSKKVCKKLANRVLWKVLSLDGHRFNDAGYIPSSCSRLRHCIFSSAVNVGGSGYMMLLSVAVCLAAALK